MTLNGVSFNSEWVARQEKESFVERFQYIHFTNQPLETRKELLEKVYDLCRDKNAPQSTGPNVGNNAKAEAPAEQISDDTEHEPIRTQKKKKGGH